MDSTGQRSNTPEGVPKLVGSSLKRDDVVAQHHSLCQHSTQGQAASMAIDAEVIQHVLDLPRSRPQSCRKGSSCQGDV